jgi:hypothetical protein
MMKIARCKNSRSFVWPTLYDSRMSIFHHWQSRPAHERLDAVEEMIQAAYALLKHGPSPPNVPTVPTGGTSSPAASGSVSFSR